MWKPVRHLIASENENYGSTVRESWSRDSKNGDGHRDETIGGDKDGFVDSVRRKSQYSKAFLGFVHIIFHHVL